MNVLNVILFMSGVTLIYSGIKGYKPQSVLAWALGGKKPTGWDNSSHGTKLGGVGGSGVAPGQHPGDMPWTYPHGGKPASSTSTNPVAGGIVSV